MESSAADLSTASRSGSISVDLPRCDDEVPSLTVLCHPRHERVGERAVLSRIAAGAAARLSRLEPLFAHPRGGGGAGSPLDDNHLSRRPSRLLRLADGKIRLELGETRTRFAADGQPVGVARDFSSEEVRRGVVLELADRIVLLLHFSDPATLEGDDLGMVGESALVQRVRREIRHVADAEVAVLVRGQTGSGKELVARAIHEASARRGGPFVALNMATLPPLLANAELFGAERGAFTGADRRRPGYLELADGGTLFLDEIGETPPEVQAMLLRVLETREIQPLGASQARRVDVRFVTATDADLEAKMANGGFRAPLFHRLAGYEIVVPRLCQRRDDIGRLFFHFLREELERVGEARRLDATGPGHKTFVQGALLARLCRHDWPGNVRELRNVVRQLVLASRGAATLKPGRALERCLVSPAVAAPPRAAALAAPPSRRKPAEVSEEELLEALRGARWDFKAASARLRISRTSLYALVEACTRTRKVADLEPDEISRCLVECDGDVDAVAARLEVSKRALQRRMRELRRG